VAFALKPSAAVRNARPHRAGPTNWRYLQQHWVRSPPADPCYFVLKSLRLNQRPRDELFVCLSPACNAKCKRIYDLKRHYTAVHNREGGLGYFCPVDGCSWLKLPSAFLSLWYGYSSCGAVKLYYGPTKTCILALQGFARKDKWLRHLKREHKVSLSPYSMDCPSMAKRY
jgi:hypothetical protein